MKVEIPLRIKFHAQPGRSPMSFMLVIPSASKPEKTPEKEAAEQIAEIPGTMGARINRRNKRIMEVCSHI